MLWWWGECTTYIQGASANVYCSSSACLMLRTHSYLFMHWPAFLYYVCLHLMYIQLRLNCSFQLLKWPSPPWPCQAGRPPLWVSPGQPATPSATPSLCPTPPKMAPSMSPNLLTVTPPTLWPPFNPAPIIELRWRLWGRETEQTDRGQRS